MGCAFLFLHVYGMGGGKKWAGGVNGVCVFLYRLGGVFV